MRQRNDDTQFRSNRITTAREQRAATLPWTRPGRRRAGRRDGGIPALFKSKTTGRIVLTSGTIVKILPDDVGTSDRPEMHLKFLVELSDRDRTTIKIANNLKFGRVPPATAKSSASALETSTLTSVEASSGRTATAAAPTPTAASNTKANATADRILALIRAACVLANSVPKSTI